MIGLGSNKKWRYGWVIPIPHTQQNIELLSLYEVYSLNWVTHSRGFNSSFLLVGNFFKDSNTSFFLVILVLSMTLTLFAQGYAHCILQANSFGLALFLTGQTKSLRLYVVFASPSHWRFLRWVRCSFSKIKILRLDRHISPAVNWSS